MVLLVSSTTLVVETQKELSNVWRSELNRTAWWKQGFNNTLFCSGTRPTRADETCAPGRRTRLRSAPHHITESIINYFFTSFILLSSVMSAFNPPPASQTNFHSADSELHAEKLKEVKTLAGQKLFKCMRRWHHRRPSRTSHEYQCRRGKAQNYMEIS